MVQDVLERIREAEAQAEQIKAEARRQADEILTQARHAANSLIEETKRAAREEATKLIAAEEAKAIKEAEEIRRQGLHQATQIHTEAQKHLATAVEFVFQRVVMQP